MQLLTFSESEECHTLETPELEEKMQKRFSKLVHLHVIAGISYFWRMHQCSKGQPGAQLQPTTRAKLKDWTLVITCLNSHIFSSDIPLAPFVSPLEGVPFTHLCGIWCILQDTVLVIQLDNRRRREPFGNGINPGNIGRACYASLRLVAI